MAEEQNKIKTILPEPTLRRLPWYLAYVNLLQKQKVEYVSSTQIAKETFSLQSDDRIVITGGVPNGHPGNTNLIKIETIP